MIASPIPHAWRKINCCLRTESSMIKIPASATTMVTTVQMFLCSRGGDISATRRPVFNNTMESLLKTNPLIFACQSKYAALLLAAQRNVHPFTLPVFSGELLSCSWPIHPLPEFFLYSHCKLPQMELTTHCVSHQHNQAHRRPM